MDIISNPLKHVDAVFRSCCGDTGKGYDPNWIDKVSPTFLQCLQKERLDEIPVLTGATLDSLRVNSLVRYTGLVQDTFDPEWYTAVSEVREEASGESRQLPLAFSDTVTPAGPGVSVTVHHDVMERR